MTLDHFIATNSRREVHDTTGESLRCSRPTNAQGVKNAEVLVVGGLSDER